MIKTYGQIINETLSEEMEKDSSIFLFGEDIGVYGGAFGITKGLFEKYGKNRVIDSPMSEQSIVGLGVGAAVGGLKPIIEIMFMDFMTLAYDQLLNHACIFNYLSEGKISVPLVIRVPAGGGRGYGATHSKTLISPLMHIPGIKIVVPSDAADVKGLLRASIQDKNPVIFVEHKSLYTSKTDSSNVSEFIEIGKGKIVKEGKQITLVSFSKAVKDCLKVAEKLESESISAEVIDLRTIKPFDFEIIKRSLEKTGRLVVVEEGYSSCGVASEIITQVNEKCFSLLKSPPKRVCSLDVPISCFPTFENQIIPSVERIEKSVKESLNA